MSKYFPKWMHRPPPPWLYRAIGTFSIALGTYSLAVFYDYSGILILFTGFYFVCLGFNMEKDT